MELNGFTVNVVGGQEGKDGYVGLHDGQTYALALGNNNHCRCDARVEIDGKHVGSWRVNGYQSIILERPANDDGKFTFYQAGTRNARQAGINYHNPDLGLIKVTFTPEQEYLLRKGVGLLGDPNECSYRGAKGAGGTGLSGHSAQKYGTASNIEYDYSKQAIINLRLYAINESPRPLTNVNSTPEPPRIW